MSDIARFDFGCYGLTVGDDGEFVKYDDHIEAMTSLLAELHTAITRAEEAEKARDEWCEVSQKNYQLAKSMQKMQIDNMRESDGMDRYILKSC